jgi:hypothetical protein
MAIETVEKMLQRFRELGAERVFFKKLAENDNSKQQVYLGSSFAALNFFPYGEIVACPDLKEPNFKAPLDFFWIDENTMERARGAQLILYPAYPEVRLSGFLAGCRLAPSKHMRQIPEEFRRGFDGRVLIFATTEDGRTYAYLAIENSALANELRAIPSETDDLLIELTLPVGSQENRQKLLDALREIHRTGPHSSKRLYANGEIKPYTARNGGGYTLEALLGIAPNSRAEPDYMGWEIKAYTKSRVTLMTPEPNGGFYGREGVRAFVEKYGHLSAAGDKYFTGAHKVNKPNELAGTTLKLKGYNPNSPDKMAVDGAIYLVDALGEEVATWDFSSLLTHWNRKHAFAAYVPTERYSATNEYHYKSPILMGEQTDFSKYLQALANGMIVFDPGSKIYGPDSDKAGTVKARSQFRISVKDLSNLYGRFTAEDL